MHCSRCGTQVPDDQRVCPRCGNRLRAVPQAMPQNQQRPQRMAPYAVPDAGVRGHRQAPGPLGKEPTQYVRPRRSPAGNTGRARELSLTFIEDGVVLAETTLDLSRPVSLTFGSSPSNDIVVNAPSHTVSGRHAIISVHDGWCMVQDAGSLNGLYLNGAKQQTTRLATGDVVSIGRPKRGAKRCVMIVGDARMGKNLFPLTGHNRISIGRDAANDLVIPDPTVSSFHAVLQRDRSGWSLTDQSSTNGTKVDGTFVLACPLCSGQSITFGNAQCVFLDESLLVMAERHGVDVTARELVRYRKNGRVTRITTDHVSLHIKRGDFVAIVGGSGCGKSTLLNELSGQEPADEGTVQVDGTDLYANYNRLKTGVGYVPQQDIVYDGLTLEDMLASAAKLRMQPDTTREEREKRIAEVVDMLELGGVLHNLIGNLSGGQKKRASIAVELMADPRLLFLDEPTSGLDPGIERKLMQTLAAMAHDGRTIILVTHTTLNLHLCDQVVFLAPGGKLAYAGQPGEAKSFFGVSDFVDVYGLIEEDGDGWQQRFARWRATHAQAEGGAAAADGQGIAAKPTPSFASQLATLSGRYAKLMGNDRSRMALLLLQAPGLAALISLVAGASCFEVFENTKSCLFALSCAAFWVGILDSIQEICKERQIVVRDYDGGVRLGSYLCSKILVLGTLCLIQAASLTIVFCLMKGVPDGALTNPYLELFCSLFLTTLSAMAIGLLVSALFKNPDRAIALAPLLIMPQILFSGLVFELKGVSESISYAVTCRWAMEALGTTADLNELDLKLYGEKITVPAEPKTLHDQTIHVPASTQTVDMGEPFGEQEVDIPEEDRTFESIEVQVPETETVIDAEMFEHEADEMFEHSMAHLARSWGILLSMALLCFAGCFVLLYMGLRK